jgi:hypothetical protein
MTYLTGVCTDLQTRGARDLDRWLWFLNLLFGSTPVKCAVYHWIATVTQG